MLNFCFNDERVVLKRSKVRVLSEASLKITDKISDFRSEQNEALRSEIINQSRNLRFNNNHTALIFGSFEQAKEQHQPLFY
jgi:hypothetical protein